MESDFAGLEALMQGVMGAISGIVVEGTDAFKAAVYSDFGWLMSQPVGQLLVSDLIASGKTVTLREGRGGNSAGYDPDQATGLGELSTLVLSENRFRSAFALPPRPAY